MVFLVIGASVVLALLQQHVIGNHTPVGQIPSVAAPATAPPSTGRILAIGSASPAGALATGLRASSAPQGITIESSSSIPVSIQVSDGYGAPLRRWRTLPPGRSHVQTIVTGRSYGYCFTQAAGAGYAQTRGCGTLVIHSFINGVEIPDGGAVTTSVTFASQ